MSEIRWIGKFRHQGGSVLIADEGGFRGWGGCLRGVGTELTYYGPLVARLPVVWRPGTDSWHQRLEVGEDALADTLAALERDALSLGDFAITKRSASASGSIITMLDRSSPMLSVIVKAASPEGCAVTLASRGSTVAELPTKLKKWFGADVELPCLEAAAEIVDDLVHHLQNTPHLHLCARSGFGSLPEMLERAHRAGGEPLGSAAFAGDWIHGRDSVLTVTVSEATDASRTFLQDQPVAEVSLQRGRRGVVWQALGLDDDGEVDVGVRTTSAGVELILATLDFDDEEQLRRAREVVESELGTHAVDLPLQDARAVCASVNEPGCDLSSISEPSAPLRGPLGDDGWVVALQPGTYAVFHAVHELDDEVTLVRFCRLVPVR